MTKKEGIIFALGGVKGFLECDKDYKTIKLGEFFGEKYDRYELGLSNGTDSICLYDTKTKTSKGLRRAVIECDRHFYFDDLVNILLQGLAFDIRLQKE